MARAGYEERDRILQLLADQLRARLADLIASLPGGLLGVRLSDLSKAVSEAAGYGALAGLPALLPDALLGELAQQAALLADPYLAAAGELAADWYESSDPASGYRAAPARLPDPAKLRASARWGLSPLSVGAGATALDWLAGAAGRWVRNAARETTVANADTETGARWARVARADACAFCRMLATREDVYASSRSALSVVGRYGRPRGKAKLGSGYHDHCRCLAVEVRPGQVYRPPEHASEWEDQYVDAKDRAVEEGYPMDYRNAPKSIARAWRELHGAR